MSKTKPKAPKRKDMELSLENDFPLLYKINQLADDGILVFDLVKPRPIAIGIYHEIKARLEERGIEFRSYQLNRELKQYSQTYKYLKNASLEKCRVTLEGKLVERDPADIIKATSNWKNCRFHKKHRANQLNLSKQEKALLIEKLSEPVELNQSMKQAMEMHKKYIAKKAEK